MGSPANRKRDFARLLAYSRISSSSASFQGLLGIRMARFPESARKISSAMSRRATDKANSLLCCEHI